MRSLPLLLVFACFIAIPGTVLAQELPPDESGIDQYVESVPGAGGDRTSEPDGGSGGGSGGGSALTPQVSNALEERGATGAAVSDLAKATGPDADGDGGGGQSGRAHGGSAPGDKALTGVALASDQGSGTAGVVSAVFGGAGGGMGVALPIILAGGLLAALLSLRGRGRTGSE